MHIGARGIGGINGVADLGEDEGAVVDLLRIGGVRGVELGGDGELPLAQHALEPAARAVARQRGKRIGRIDVALGRHGALGATGGLSARGFSTSTLSDAGLAAGFLAGVGAGSVLSRTTFSQEEWPLRRLSTGFWTSRIAPPLAICCDPSQACTQTHFISGLTSQWPLSRTPPQGPLRRFFGQFIEQDMPVEESAHCPHIWQSKRNPFNPRSTAATGFSSRLYPIRFSSGAMRISPASSAS